MTDTVIVSRLVAEVLSPQTYCGCYTGPEPAPPEEKLLTGSITISPVVVGRLSKVPTLSGSVRMGKTQVNGRLSVTHDLAIFNNV